MLTLYHGLASTCSKKVRMCLAEKGLAYESRLMNLVHFQTAVASKAARCVLAAGGKPVVEFGMRRSPGLDGALKAARCAWIASAGLI